LKSRSVVGAPWLARELPAPRVSIPKVTVLAVLACVLLLCAPAELTEALAYRRTAILDGQWWRLWSGHLVHFSARHAVLDGAVLALIGMVLEPRFGARRMGAILLAGAPLIGMSLLVLVPDMEHYRGASGLGMLLTAAVGVLLWQHERNLRARLALLGLALLVKTGADLCGLGGVQGTLPPLVALAWQAHVAGALYGALMGAWVNPDRRTSARALLA
jgi:rhomboid family GlyGly-CTERM serine protease